MNDRWLSINDAASVFSLSRRNTTRALMRCYQGFAWKGHSLIVRRVRGRGGNGGWCYEVRLDSLPAELQLQYVPLTPFETVFNKPLNGPSNWRYSIIEEALKCPPGSRTRAAAIKTAAAKSHFKPDGSRKQLTERTLRNWIREYESKGYDGLGRTSRADRNQRKVLITRQWDRAIKLPEDIKEQIAEKIERYIRSNYFPAFRLIFPVKQGKLWRWVRFRLLTPPLNLRRTWVQSRFAPEGVVIYGRLLKCTRFLI